MSRKISECGEDLCPVCSEVVTIFSIGKCGHMICYRCSTRMRVLCDQLYCAICRSDLPEVVFLGKVIKLSEIPYKKFRCNIKGQVYFENEDYETAFYRLLEHGCKKCPELKPFRHFGALKDHIRKEHGLQYCDLCVKHIKLFSLERKVYTRQQLAQHRRVGDSDDKSHKGHPLCQFCDDRYLDNDELLRHLRKDHYFCHFCDADGITNQFYGDYNFLKGHFRDSHFLCEEGECYEAEFTNAFRSEIDFKGHLAAFHSKGMRRQQQRQTRTIDIDFNYASSRHSGRRDRERGVLTGGDYEENRRQNRGRGLRQQRAKEREELETAQAIRASLSEVQRSGHVNVVDQELVRPQLQSQQAAPKETVKYEKNTEDFPTLDGRTMSDSDTSSEENDKGAPHQPTLAKKFAVAQKFSVAHGSMREEDFPTLGNAPTKFATTSSRVWGSSSTSQKDYPSLSSGRGTGGGGVEGGSRGPPSKQTVTTYSQPPVVQHSNFASSDFPSLSSIGSGLLTNSSKDNKRPAANSSMSHSTKVLKQNPVPSSQQSKTSVASKPQKPSQPNSIPGSNFAVEKTKSSKSTKKTKDSVASSVASTSKSAGVSERLYNANSSVKLEPAFKESNISKTQDEYLALAKSYDKEVEPVKPDRALSKPLSSKSHNDDFPSFKESNISKTQNEYPALAKSYDKEVEPVKSYRALSKPLSSKSHNDDFPALGKEPKVQTSVQWGPKQAQKSSSNESNENFVTVKTKTNRRRKKNPKSNSKRSSLENSDSEGSDNELDKFSTTTKHFEVLENLKEKENKKEVFKAFDRESKSEKKQTKQEKQGTIVPNNKVLSNSHKNDDDKKEFSENYCNGKTVEPEQDFSSLSLLKDQSNLPGFNALPLSDFPVLAGSNSSTPASQSAPKPPPGFSNTATIPPPGFAKPPPGFTMPSIHFESQQEQPASTPTTGPLPQHTYTQPKDATIRNQALLTAIQEHTSKSDYFGQFRSASGEFRKGQLSALDYYNKCASLIGLDNFLAVFPELLALLPDIPKQQELLTAHNTHRKCLAESTGKKNKSRWNARDNTFQTCSVCGQVLIQSDYSCHINEHSLDEEFPSLS